MYGSLGLTALKGGHVAVTGLLVQKILLSKRKSTLWVQSPGWRPLDTHTYTHTKFSGKQKVNFPPKGLTGRKNQSLALAAHRKTSEVREKALCSETPVFNRSWWHLQESACSSHLTVPLASFVKLSRFSPLGTYTGNRHYKYSGGMLISPSWERILGLICTAPCLWF